MNKERFRLAMLSAHTCPLGRLGARDAGGMNVYVRELATQLGKMGHFVDVFTRIYDPEQPVIVHLNENARVIHLEAGVHGDIEKLALYPHLPDFISNIESFRQANAIKYDIIFSHYWLSGLVGKVLQSRWQVPHLLMFHTLGLVKNMVGANEFEPELRIESEKALIAETGHIVATTDRERRTLETLYGARSDQIVVIPCGVNLDTFRPVDKNLARHQLGIKSQEKFILFVGRIEPIKGLDRLVESIALLKDIDNTRLLILGGDVYSKSQLERLQALASRLGISDRIAFGEPVPQSTLPVYYSAADVFVLPSYSESFGLVALEALACGTPVVATDVGDLKNIIQPRITGYIAPDNTPQNLAAKLALVLNRSEPFDRGLLRASVYRFGWEGIAVQVAAECARLIAANSTAKIQLD